LIAAKRIAARPITIEIFCAVFVLRAAAVFGIKLRIKTIAPGVRIMMLFLTTPGSPV
jgi:hypothetical protein